MAAFSLPQAAAEGADMDWAPLHGRRCFPFSLTIKPCSHDLQMATARGNPEVRKPVSSVFSTVWFAHF